jgi:hypothetical protein
MDEGPSSKRQKFMACACTGVLGVRTNVQGVSMDMGLWSKGQRFMA